MDGIDDDIRKGASPTVATEWISCNACGADDYVRLGSVDGWTIGRCGKCGLIYVNPAPFFEPNEEFSSISLGFEYTDYMHKPVDETILTFETRQLLLNMEEMVQLTGRRKLFGSFLDVGCGSGASVRAAADLGWRAVGIDIDPVLVGKGRDQLGADLRCIDLLHSDLPDGEFDFIKLRDVIEHMPNPYEVLLKIKDLLAPDGVVLFTTPNEGTLPNRVRVLARRPKSKVATVPPPHHLHGFDEVSLTRILRRAGLRVLEMHTATPVDPRYVTSRNVKLGSQQALRLVWSTGKALGMGSMLIAWAGR
jgi:2-polyprenyl-3-methyl-5-hydroxy-6-metoxy-1,4-benzoquinol methylase